MTVGAGGPDEEVTGAIGPGILALVGVTHDDTEAQARKLADKIAQLRIFDAAGREVRVIDAGHLPAGDQALAWDGRDAHGGNVSSGLYFARLALDGAVQDEVLKLTLLK